MTRMNQTTKSSDYILDIAAFEMWQRENCDNKSDDEAFKKIVSKVIQNELNEKEREIIFLYYYEKHTMKEIADYLNVSISAVCKRLKHIRHKLYGFLKYVAELHYGRAIC